VGNKGSVPSAPLHTHVLRDRGHPYYLIEGFRKFRKGKVVSKLKLKAKKRRRPTLKNPPTTNLTPWFCCSSVGFYNRTAAVGKKTAAVRCACNTSHPVAGLVYWMAGVWGASKPHNLRHASLTILFDLPLRSLTIMWGLLFHISDKTHPQTPLYIHSLINGCAISFILIFNFLFISMFCGQATPNGTTKLMVITTSKGSSVRDSRKGPTNSCHQLNPG